MTVVGGFSTFLGDDEVVVKYGVDSVSGRVYLVEVVKKENVLSKLSEEQIADLTNSAAIVYQCTKVN